MAKRKAIPTDTKLRLFAESSGHCQRPECLDPLFPSELNGVKHIAEIAHVLPHGEAGPRSEEIPEGVNQHFAGSSPTMTSTVTC